jgi:hypothetical protein
LVAPSKNVFFASSLSPAAGRPAASAFFYIGEVCVRGRCDIIRLTEIAQIKCAMLAAAGGKTIKCGERDDERAKEKKVPPAAKHPPARLRQTRKWSRCQLFFRSANYITETTKPFVYRNMHTAA